MSKQVLDLLGSFVSFKIKQFETLESEIDVTKGLVTSVCLNLDGDHEICVKQFDDTEDFHKISEIDSLKVAQLDPYAFFENIKSGLIEVEI